MSEKRKPYRKWFYATKEWKEQRARQLAMHPLCAWPMCDRAAEQVDHVLPLEQGGTSDLSNLQSLCAYHHNRKTHTVDGYRRRGTLQPRRCVHGFAEELCARCSPTLSNRPARQGAQR